MILASVFLISTVAVWWGAALALRLPEIDCRLDRKPFNCRPCLTFHLTWAMHAFFAVMVQSATLFVAGLVAAFAVFAVVWHIDNSKIEK